MSLVQRRAFWFLAVVISSAAITSGWGLHGFLPRPVSAVQPQQKERISVNDARPVASAIASLETRFGRIITYEDPPFAHPDDTHDVTESVRRDLDKYAPGKAPRVIVPRGGELSVEFDRDDPVEVVLSYVLGQSERVTTSTTFRTEQTNGMIHVIPQTVKGPGGETVAIRSILDGPVRLPAEPRDGMEMLEAWKAVVSNNSKIRIFIGSVPLNLFLRNKDDQGLNSQTAREALSEILTRYGRGVKLSWQLFYEPGQRTYAINIHRVKS